MSETTVKQSSVTAFVGELEVLANGVVHVTRERIFSVKIGGLEMRFDFIEDKDDTTISTVNKIEGPILTWTLKNYLNSLGEGVIEPVKLGRFMNRDLYASFYVWSPDSKNGRRLISYVVYLGQERA